MVFILGQKYLSWHCSVLCTRGGKQHCVVQERALSPFLVCGHWYLRGRWSVLREAHIAVLSLVLCVTCVCSKSLVLLCKRTSPPGAHEVYVQNNKWQMNNHKSINVFWLLFGHLWGTPQSLWVPHSLPLSGEGMSLLSISLTSFLPHVEPGT